MGSGVDWSLPAAKPDPVYGTGVRREERLLALAVAAAATVGVLVAAAADAQVRWAIWQYLVAGIVAFDLAGGVVANGLNSAKRDHFARESTLGATLFGRLVRRPILFAAVHVQPILVGLLFSGGTWWWGLVWYLIVLTSVIVVRRVPLYLQRPAALSFCVLAALLTPVVAAPNGFWWLPTIMVLKLTLAHAVQEEPYRPLPIDDAGRSGHPVTG